MTEATAALSPSRGRPLVIADGTIEGLKYLAVVLMTVDHINKYLFKGAVESMFILGRLAFPVFAFVVAYNLARPGDLSNGTAARMGKRLVFFGVISSPAFVALGGLIDGWWPLNIMLTFALTVGVITLCSIGGIGNVFAAGAAFVVGGALVEFWWPGVAICFTAWCFCRSPSWFYLSCWLLASASLVVVNGNYWAIAAVPLVLGAQYVNLPISRHRHLFYAYYPFHLAALWVVKRTFF